jgi:HlyD family secretion protein
VRAEQIASLAAEIAKAKSRLEYAEQQLTRTTYLTGHDAASQQALDQATNDAVSARVDVAEAQANHDAAVAGPTKEERAIADAQVKAAASALAVLERQLDKTILRAPADGVVSVIVGEVGENIHAGQPVLVVEATGKQWLSFNARRSTARAYGRIEGRRCTGGCARGDAGTRYRIGATRVLRDLAGRAGSW